LCGSLCADPCGRRQAPGSDAPYDEDAALQLALQMSLAEQQADDARRAKPDAGAAQPDAGVNAVLMNAEFLNEMLTDLPGVDPSDARVQELLAQMKGKGGGGKDQDDGKDEQKDGK
jgi:hypothetical protein